ncbi:MAG: hypothetical protein ABIF19_17255, partial [Planctomycetota bacterium]
MSRIDENEIRDRLKRLSQIEPAEDSAERAMKRIRDTLMTDEGVGWANASFAHAEFRRVCNKLHTLRLTKLAAAAVLLIGAGFLAGRLTGPGPIDVEALRADLESSLRSSLEPAIRQSLLEEMDNRWQPAFEANCAQLKEQLQQQVRRDLMQFAAQTLAASGTQTDQRLRELIQLIEAARMQDR